MSFFVFLQRDAMDCGPSCLAMIIKYYHGTFDIEHIRQQCALGRSGVSLLGISRAAESIGFKSIGGRITLETLCKELKFPCILHWEQNHFVVLYRITKNRKGKLLFHIADPAKGVLVYNKSEFIDHWVSTVTNGEEKGIVLLLEPTEKNIHVEQRHMPSLSRLQFLWSYLKKYSFWFLQLVIGLFVASLLQLILPFLTQSIVDVGIGGKDISFIWIVLLAQFMLLLSRTAIDFIRSKILLHISTRISLSLLSDFFIKLMRLPMRFFDTKLMGDLLQRIEDHRRVEQFLTSNSLTLLFSFFSFIVFGIVLAVYDTGVFVIFVLGTIFYALWIIVFINKRKEIDYKYFDASGKNRNVTYQLINGMQEIKLQGCEQKKRWEWEDIQANLFKINTESLNLAQIQQAGSVVINEFKNMLITIVVASAVIRGEMTLGMMLAIQYIIGQLNTPVEQLIHFIYSWQDVSISLDRMNEIHIEKNEENKQRIVSHLDKQDIPNLQINNLSFKYDINAPAWVLKDIQLYIPHNKVTAIVGASGSGKTTLIKLLLGYYEPIKGEVKVGNKNLKECNLGWWRSQCGAVMQEGYIFSDTIAQNIAISDENPDIDRIRTAANIANIADHIEALPLGYNTIIGQDGQGLSQGQRQRILIARIIYKQPQFVFLDEATNSLDANNERSISEKLSSFYQEKTVVVVAHRLSTVKNADQIVVLEHGSIVEIGTHDTLTARKGKYYELVKNQLELGA